MEEIKEGRGRPERRSSLIGKSRGFLYEIGASPKMGKGRSLMKVGLDAKIVKRGRKGLPLAFNTGRPDIAGKERDWNQEGKEGAEEQKHSKNTENQAIALDARKRTEANGYWSATKNGKRSPGYPIGIVPKTC